MCARVFRPAGENQQFADGPALYSKVPFPALCSSLNAHVPAAFVAPFVMSVWLQMEADNKAAKDTVRRWHNKK